MMLLSGARVVDLTRVLEPGKEPFKLEVNTYFVDELLPGFHRPEGQWYVMQEWEISSHIGTHVESPYHHVRDGADVGTLSLEQMMGEAVVLDFTHKQAGEPITAQEVKGTGIAIRAGDIVLVHTGFDRLYGQPNYNRPYVSLEATEWLVERGIKCLGIDASGLEKYKDEAQPGHLLLFEHNIPIIEELTHLEQIRQPRFTFMGLPIPIRGADACPIRAIAIEEG